MQELINKLIAEVGLTAEQASKTVSTIMDHLKAKLPSSLSGNLEAMFSGAKGEAKEATSATDTESLKDKAEDLANATKDKLEDLAEQAKDKLSEAADIAEEMAKDAFGKLKGIFGGEKGKE